MLFVVVVVADELVWLVAVEELDVVLMEDVDVVVAEELEALLEELDVEVLVEELDVEVRVEELDEVVLVVLCVVLVEVVDDTSETWNVPVHLTIMVDVQAVVVPPFVGNDQHAPP